MFNGVSFSSGWWKRSGTDGEGGGTTLRIYGMPLSYALKKWLKW